MGPGLEPETTVSDRAIFIPAEISERVETLVRRAGWSRHRGENRICREASPARSARGGGGGASPARRVAAGRKVIQVVESACGIVETTSSTGHPSGCPPMVAQENCARAFSASETGGARGLDDTSSEPTWREVFEFIAEHPDGAGLAEIAAAFGMTSERVRQLEQRALAKVRLALRRI